MEAKAAATRGVAWVPAAVRENARRRKVHAMCSTLGLCRVRSNVVKLTMIDVTILFRLFLTSGHLKLLQSSNFYVVGYHNYEYLNRNPKISRCLSKKGS